MITSSKQTCRSSTDATRTRAHASMPGRPSAEAGATSTSVRAGCRPPIRLTTSSAASPAARLSTTMTRVSTLVRTAARTSPRRSSGNASSIWPTVTCSASHVPSTVIVVVTAGTSRLAPLAAVALEQGVGLVGPPRAGLVLGDRRLADRPRVEDRVADTPRLLDLVGADEQRGIADERVEEQPLVRLGWLLQERGAVEEVHRHG